MARYLRGFTSAPEWSAFEQASMLMIGGAGEGMADWAQQVMAKSLEICPVDTGTLRGSSFIYHDVAVNGDPTVTMGYGMGDRVNPKTHRIAAEYAVPVHERVEVYHQPPTQAKFLEDPCFEFMSVLPADIAARMREALASGEWYQPGSHLRPIEPGGMSGFLPLFSESMRNIYQKYHIPRDSKGRFLRGKWRARRVRG